mgnify:CR=1 FL=1
MQPDPKKRERVNHWIELYKKMLTIRKFEDRVRRLYADGEIPGFVHLYTGQEAIAVGACANLNDTDYITSTHRGHGHAIAKGANLRFMMAELFGKKTGYCKGKGGSMHIADLDLGILGANGIVAGSLPIAVGAAYGSSKIRKTDQVVVAFFGDGATNEGAFHEAMNMAAAWSLPVIFVCENNQFGVSTRISRVVKETDLAKRAVGYGMPGISIDGNDVLEVESAVHVAVNRARKGHGPMFLVANTFRHRGHFEGEVINYWGKNELEEWKKRDPLAIMEQRLRASGIGDEEFGQWDREIGEAIEDAVAFARSSEYPQPEDALNDLFTESGEPA